jgi:hypothetical protein
VAKSEYAAEHQLDLHIDDMLEYGAHFTTPFALFKASGK